MIGLFSWAHMGQPSMAKCSTMERLHGLDEEIGG